MLTSSHSTQGTTQHDMHVILIAGHCRTLPDICRTFAGQFAGQVPGFPGLSMETTAPGRQGREIPCGGKGEKTQRKTKK